MKVIIAGSRTFKDKGHLFKQLDHFRTKNDVTEIVSGGAQGPDTFGEEYGQLHGIKVTVFPADWTKHGRAAGPIRNVEMAEYADAVVAAWDGVSRGTDHMIKQMHKRKKPVYVVFPADHKFLANVE